MLQLLHDWLARSGLATAAPWASRLILVAALLLLAWLAGRIVRFLLVRGSRRIATRTKSAWDDALIEHRVFERISQVIPALVAYLAAGAAFPAEEEVVARELLQRLASVWMIVALARSVSAFFDSIGTIARKSPATRDKPIRGYLQVAKILLWLTTAVLAVATLMDRSPWALLGGLGAMTAIIILVFRDSILGFVASIQIGNYDLVRVGEWVEVPKYGADGEVIDVSLHTVRIQNWDKTIVTIPTTALLTEGFKNWRGMTLSGGRRIKRALHLDLASVRFLTDDELDRLGEVDALRDYLESRRAEIERWNDELPEGDFLGRRRLTNIGTYRAYVESYLRRHPDIHGEMTFLVRQLAPGPDGLPLEVYVFSRQQSWAEYEAIMADLFDHLIAAASRFDLRIFQHPTGADVRQPLRELARAVQGAEAEA